MHQHVEVHVHSGAAAGGQGHDLSKELREAHKHRLQEQKDDQRLRVAHLEVVHASEILLKARKDAYKKMAEKRIDHRMKNHIIERNKNGADLPMPKSWGPVRVGDVSSRYNDLDTNRDGIISNREYYSMNTKMSVNAHGS